QLSPASSWSSPSTLAAWRRLSALADRRLPIAEKCADHSRDTRPPRPEIGGTFLSLRHSALASLSTGQPRCLHRARFLKFHSVIARGHAPTARRFGVRCL